MVFNSLFPHHHGGIKQSTKKIGQQLEDGEEVPSYNILHKYFLHKKPILVHLNDNNSRLSSYHIDQLQFTLNYTEYAITEKHMQICSNISTHYMNRFDMYFMSPNNHFMVILSDVEWWNSNNRTILVSLLCRHRNKIIYKEKALIIDYPVCVHSKSSHFSFIGKSLFIMHLIESQCDVFIDEVELSDDLFSSKKPIVYKQRIQLKLQGDVVSSPLDHFVAISKDTFIFQNDKGVILYSVDQHKFGPFCNIKKSVYCQEYIHKGAQFIIATHVNKYVISTTLYKIDHDKNRLALQETFDINVSFLSDHYREEVEKLIIAKMVFSSFLGFRMYLLLQEDILVVDLLDKCLCAHLRLSGEDPANIHRMNYQQQMDINKGMQKDLLVSDNGREIVYIESLSVQVFYLDIEIYSEMNLKYLSGLAVNRYFDHDDIEKLHIPLSFKTYLLS